MIVKVIMVERKYGVLLASFSKHSHQNFFIPSYLGHPRIRIVAVTDESDVEPELKSENEKRARELNVPYVEGFDRALQLDDVDIVSIGHEIERRADLAIRAAAAGKHLWIDKYIGATIEECDEVVKRVETAGVKSIIPSYVYGELVGRSRAVIDSGVLGELLGVHADAMFGKNLPQEIAEQDRKSPFLPPGRWKFPDIKRELLTVGAYAAALVQTCLGRISHICGFADAYFFPEHAAHGADDFGTLTMTDGEGRVATLCGGRVGMAVHAYGGLSRAWLIGAKGSVLVDANRPALDVFVREDIINADYSIPSHDPMQWHSHAPSMGTSLAEDQGGLSNGLEDLVQALDEDRMPSFTVREARDHMEILIAGYTAVVNGETVDLPLKRQAN